MAKKFHPAVLTANDLNGGHSVFLAAEGWSAQIGDALVAVSPDQAADLTARATSHGADQDVIGPYLVDVSLDNGTPEPLLRRERIRAAGRPSIDFGEAPAIHRAA